MTAVHPLFLLLLNFQKSLYFVYAVLKISTGWHHKARDTDNLFQVPSFLQHLPFLRTHPNIWNVQWSISCQLDRNRGLVMMSCCRRSWMTSFEIHFGHQRAAETFECVSRNWAFNSSQLLMFPACRAFYHVITVFPQLLGWTLTILNIDIDSCIFAISSHTTACRKHTQMTLDFVMDPVLAARMPDSTEGWIHIEPAAVFCGCTCWHSHGRESLPCFQKFSVSSLP